MADAVIRVQFPGKPLIELSLGEVDGRIKVSLPAANGDSLPFMELEPHGPGFQIQRLGYPTGAVQVDANGKVLVSGMVNQ